MICCIKQVQDPEAPPATFQIDAAANRVIPPAGIPPVISPFDEQAIEAALRIKDAQGGKVTALCMGTNLVSDVVKKPLAMGADELVLLEDASLLGGDSYSIAYALVQAIKKIGEYDIIFCGRQAADWDRGQVGVGIAELLGIPLVTLAQKVEAADGNLRVERVITDGYNVVEVAPPVMITVSNELGEARYPTMRGIMTARRKPVTNWTAQDIEADASQIGPASARMKMMRLFIPARVGECEIIEGENVADSAVKLAERLRESRLL